jgi:4-hydroxybenzoate polyprenyltransferase
MNAVMEMFTDRASQYWRLMRLNRPIGNFLLLWPTLWGLWLAAEGPPRPGVLAVFVLGVLIMRAAGCVINDYADRHLDGHVQRTRARPLATGAVREREALTLFVVLCLLALALVMTMNWLTIALAPVAVVLAASYPFMKRYTHFPQLHLGAAFGWAIPMGYAAQTGAVPGQAWLVLLASVLWAAIYDTEYAMVDRDDDRRIGIKSTAVLFGDYDRLVIAVLQLMMTLLLVAIGVVNNLGLAYHGAVVIAGLLFVRQQWLIKDQERDQCFQAFLNNNIYGGVVFLGIMLDFMYA